MRKRLLLASAALAVVFGATGATAQERTRDVAPDQAQSERAKPQEKARSDKAMKSDRDTTGANTESSSAPHDQDKSTKKADDKKADEGRTSGSAHKSNDAKDEKGSAASSDKSEPSSAQKRESNEDSRSPKKSSEKAGDEDRSQNRPTAQGAKQDPASAQRNGINDKNATSDRDTKNTKNVQVERRSASLKVTEKAKLREAVSKIDVKPVTKVNFSVAVGTNVPNTVTLHPVPDRIVAIIPEYRGYDFFVVREDIVIVEPRTHRIVDIIEGVDRQAKTTTKSKLSLSTKDKEYIRKHSTVRRSTTGAAPRRETHIIIGEDLPESIELETFPAEIYRRVPAVRSYRYIQRDNNIYVIEPGSRRVIESIE